MKLTIDIGRGEVCGKPTGKIAYLVTTVDDEDNEMTSIELYLADSEEELEEIIKKEYTGDDEDSVDFEMGEDVFNDKWGSQILFRKLGEIVE